LKTIQENTYIKFFNNINLKKINEIFLKKKNNVKFVIGICFKKNNNIEGILTLGDLRRANENGNQEDNILKHINKKFLYFNHNVPLEEYNNFLSKNHNKKFDTKTLVLVLKDKKLINLIPVDEIRNGLKYKSICTIGLGHVGLPLSVYLANKKLKVFGYDKDKKKIERLKNKNTFVEKNLEELRKKVLKNKKLVLKSDFNKVYAQIYILCVGAELINNKISNINLNKAIFNLSKKIRSGDLIIFRGTMFVGQTRKIVKKIEFKSKMMAGKDFFVSYCPERLVEGNAIEELEKLPQIISGKTKNCANKSINFWGSIIKNLIEAENFEEAEIIKLSSNAYRDLIFSFSNDISKIASKYNLEILDLIDKANIGYKRNDFKKPSPGVGGSCLTKDPLLFSSNTNNEKYRLSYVSRKINLDATNEIIKRIKFIKKKFKIINTKVLIFGVTYKGDPETSDIRSSTGLDLSVLLKKNKIKYNFFDITLKKNNLIPPEISNKFILNEKKISNFDIVVLMNNHQKTEEILLKNIKKTKKNKFIYDCWNLIQKDKVEYFNYKYLSLSKFYFD